MKSLVNSLSPLGRVGGTIATLLLGLSLTSYNPTNPHDIYKGMSSREVVAAVRTPAEAANYLTNHLHRASNKKSVPFSEIHNMAYGDCTEGVLCASALLYDDGYTPTILNLYSTSQGKGHSIYLYQEKGLWGSLGINRVDIREPTYNTINDLAAEYKKYEYDIYSLAAFKGGFDLETTTTRDVEQVTEFQKIQF